MTPKQLLNTYEIQAKAFTRKIEEQFESGEIEKEQYDRYSSRSRGQEQAVVDFRLMMRDIIIL